MWARRDVVAGACPKSYVTAESVGLVEAFLVRRQLGGAGVEELSARQAEAFMVLERELEKERQAARGR
ncbi:MAG: hypothetical protein JST11_17235 [Acidobacteria bacterium]|nr:hypothetical protein [Acidobacteriota bacterium]